MDSSVLLAFKILVGLMVLIYIFFYISIYMTSKVIEERKKYNPENFSDDMLRKILKSHPVCTLGYAYCIEEYMKFDYQATSTEKICLLLTVYLKCMFEKCEVKLAKKRLEAKENLLEDLKYFATNFTCDFAFSSYNATCLYGEQYCQRKVNPKGEKHDKQTLCRYYEKYLRCFFKECVMTIPKQEKYIENQEKALADKGVTCDFNYRRLVVKGDEYDCTEMNHLYMCRNRECIHEDLVCNGEEDCWDGSDERHCDWKVDMDLDL
ncbi:uncharacterized protein LOC129925839 [Biomphalaria glabrata]|uniref:Uncharacterized protein LOC129925839 n=1 Tax=Biomphalaria glabrata TaxID=6526 RepID=A0A9W3A6I7_BIOGL|nr:uncharacterized protein LOC129925839 [Biomphalaria glabrata]